LDKQGKGGKREGKLMNKAKKRGGGDKTAGNDKTVKNARPQRTGSWGEGKPGKKKKTNTGVEGGGKKKKWDYQKKTGWCVKLKCSTGGRGLGPKKIPATNNSLIIV